MVVLGAGLAMLACSTRAPSRVIPDAPPGIPDPGADQALVRVWLVGAGDTPVVSATSDFTWYDRTGRTALGRGGRAEPWRLERSGARVRAISPDGSATAWQPALLVRAGSSGYIAVSGRRYRGDLQVTSHDDALLVINRVPLEDYLRGVVAVEMGSRPRRDSSAVQAQAVASRSFVLVRMQGAAGRAWDVRASTADQAYGGLEAENAVANAAIAATRGLVLRYNGRIVDALYSSTCGGSTAEADEIWRTPGIAYLQRVSDRIGSSDRYYCDIAPRYRWTRELSGDVLSAALDRYLAQYTTVPGGSPGVPRDLRVSAHTPSGRVAVLDVETDRGTFPLRGDDIRYVLRPPGGEMLNSTYFSVESLARDSGAEGRITRVTLRGRGYGHGVGMCQWGAIGRARAGQSFRTILGTYYTGTTIGAVQ